MKTKNWLICTWTLVQATDGNLKRQLSTPGLYNRCRHCWKKILPEWKNKDAVKPQDLAMSWYFTFCITMKFTQDPPGLGRVKTECVGAPLADIWALDKFVIYPANTLKTAERLTESQSFSWTTLSDMGGKWNIKYGNSRKSRACGFWFNGVRGARKRTTFCLLREVIGKARTINNR